MDQLKREIAELAGLGVRPLKQRFAELFGDAPNGHNKTWLIRRIVWRLQARSEGGLSERAQQRARELADDADLRVLPPRTTPGKPTVSSHDFELRTDRRLPPPGAVITRIYKGKQFQVQVRREGFEYEGERYSSLSAVAKRITGSHMNGFRFFQLETGGTE